MIGTKYEPQGDRLIAGKAPRRAVLDRPANLSLGGKSASDASGAEPSRVRAAYSRGTEGGQETRKKRGNDGRRQARASRARLFPAFIPNKPQRPSWSRRHYRRRVCTRIALKSERKRPEIARERNGRANPARFATGRAPRDQNGGVPVSSVFDLSELQRRIKISRGEIRVELNG